MKKAKISFTVIVFSIFASSIMAFSKKTPHIYYSLGSDGNCTVPFVPLYTINMLTTDTLLSSYSTAANIGPCKILVTNTY